MKAWVRQKAADVRKRGKNKAIWYVHWKEPDGTRRSRSCGSGAKGKQTANNLAAKLHSELLAGAYQGDPSLNLWSAFVSELKRVSLQKKGGSHEQGILRTIELFEEHIAPRTLDRITTRCIDEFVTKRLKDRGKKPGSTVSVATVNKDLRNLKIILKVAVEWKQLQELPKITMLKAPKRIKRFVTAEHFTDMMNAADKMMEPEIPNAGPSDYWKALIGFAFVSGWRINEILNLRRNDVNFETGQVTARWDDSKGKRDELIYVPESVLVLFQPVWNSFAERPLQWPKSRRMIYDVFFKLQKHASIDLTCEEDHEHTRFCSVYGFHDFKRSFATYNAANLSPNQLQRLMKHSDFSTTQSYIDYAKVMTERPDVFVPEVMRKNG